MRTKKWPVRVFTHFVELAISNCWIMYTRYYKLNKHKGAKSLMEFRMMVAIALCKYEGSITPRRGRPRLSESSDDEEKPQRNQRKVVSQPMKEPLQTSISRIPKFDIRVTQRVGTTRGTRATVWEPLLYLILRKISPGKRSPDLPTALSDTL
ncbi:hypothetical protein AVEN_154043-1 [Araneus ventricosus]|uniref:PiggyBac transposable element-derived protein domain-containing protein n=1 Tax=Araneus ventricosus TaxID=182803 RepID=A0A4Y2TR59_ARAVE|nr:hypothetical protein AVEN_154043-1 [Araneus ventricosus]